MEPATSTGMLRDYYERTRLLGTRRSRPVVLAVMAMALLGLGAVMVWLSPGGGRGSQQSATRTETGREGVLGTTGRGPTDSGPALTTIHELETITGATDGHELVGRQVELHVPVQQHINDVAFWVGPRDNRLLVVLARDNRDGATRQEGGPASTGLGAVEPGQQARISGTIQRVPYAEAMYSWGLTNADRAELMDRRIYLRADHVATQ